MNKIEKQALETLLKHVQLPTPNAIEYHIVEQALKVLRGKKYKPEELK